MASGAIDSGSNPGGPTDFILFGIIKKTVFRCLDSVPGLHHIISVRCGSIRESRQCTRWFNSLVSEPRFSHFPSLTDHFEDLVVDEVVAIIRVVFLGGRDRAVPHRAGDELYRDALVEEPLTVGTATVL